jgi:hypothetical protein
MNCGWVRDRKDLRPALLAPHVVDVGADAVAVAEHLARQHFVAPHDRFAAAEIDHDVAVFDALDDAVDDIADAILVFVVLPVALGLAHLLHDHLLGRLRGDAAVFERRQLVGDGVADLRGRMAAAGFLEADLVAGFSTCSTTSMWRDRCSSPLLGSISARTSVSLP